MSISKNLQIATQAQRAFMLEKLACTVSMCLACLSIMCEACPWVQTISDFYAALIKVEYALVW